MTILTVTQWVCALVFLATAVITLVALIGRIRLGGGSQASHQYYLRRLFAALILEVVAVSVASFAGQLANQADTLTTTVPPPETVKAANLPAPSLTDFELLRDMSIWDLRSWKHVPTGKQEERISPAHYLNYLHLKRRNANANKSADGDETGDQAPSSRGATGSLDRFTANLEELAHGDRCTDELKRGL